MKRFGELLFETTDDTMKRIFGESTSEMIYGFMERHVMVKREEVGERMEVFYSHLEKLLGSEGEQIIRETSLRRLCLKLQREYEEIETYLSFLDKLYEVKFKLLAPLLKEEHSVCN